MINYGDDELIIDGESANIDIVLHVSCKFDMLHDIWAQNKRF
jgi:hypothetical protein